MLQSMQCLVNQDTHQFWNSEYRMGVVQVDGDFVRQSADTWETAFVAGNDVLNGSGNQEVFLFQAQFAAGIGRVVRIQNA